MTLLPPDPVYIMKGDMGPVHSLMFIISPHSEHLYAGAESGIIHIWNLKNNREICRLENSKDSCLAMHNLGEKLLVTQRKGGTYNFWQCHNSTWIINNSFNTNYYGFCKSQTSSEKTVLMPQSDSKIGLFSVVNSKIEIELNPAYLPNFSSLGTVMGIKPCIDELKYVLVIYDGGVVHLWDIRTLKVLSTLEVEKSPMTIDFDSISMQGIIGGPSDNLEIFGLSSSNQLLEKTKITIKNNGISAISIRPDKKIFTTGGWDSQIRVFSWKSLKPLAVLNHHRETIHEIIYSNFLVQTYGTKHLMAVAGKEGNISLWNLYD